MLARTGFDVLHGVGVEASSCDRVRVLHPGSWVLRDRLCEPVGAASDFNEVLHLLEGGFAEAVEALLPVVHEEHGEQYHVAEQEREFGESSDAVLHPCEHRDHGDEGDDHDYLHLVGDILFHRSVRDYVQSSVQLHDT